MRARRAVGEWVRSVTLPALAAFFALALAATWGAARAAEDDLDTAPVHGPAADSGFVSESAAAWLSVASTVIPVALGSWVAQDDGASGAGPVLVLTGVFVGPAVGHFYARRPARALLGVGIRVVGFGAAVAAVGSAWDNESSDAETLAVLSLGVVVLSAFADIIDAPRSARKHNGEVRRARVTLGPARGAPGVSVSVAF